VPVLLADGLMVVRFFMAVIWEQEKAGRASLHLLLATLAAVLLDNLAERSRLEVEIALDGQASGSTDFLHFGEDKIAPFLFVAANITKEPEVFLILFAFCGNQVQFDQG
jgi:hypothetical protein